MVKKKIKHTKPKTLIKNTKPKPQIKKEKIDLDYFKKNKGLSIFIAIFIIGLILLVLINGVPKVNEEELYYAKGLHLQNQEYLDAYLEQVDAEINEGYFVEDLDDDYLFSIKDDLTWLKENETIWFTSNEDVFIKEVVMMLFINEIISLNEDFVFDIGTPNYELTINLAKDINFISIPVNEEFLNEATDQEKIQLEYYMDLIARKYFDLKKSYLDNTHLERQYVEAKKIVFFE